MNDHMVEAARFPDALGLGSKSRLEIDRKVKAGLTVAAVRRFLRHTGFTEADLLRTAGIAPTTWARRKREGKLSAGESERVARLALLFSHAEAIFGGPAHAKAWMERAQPALEGHRPVDLAETAFGAEEVNELLSRVEHGVF
ncbi:MAG: hypothetical protein QOE90_987 [Thermoplasmata archaeon]|jgi:putative toxin-antitoxin system antitoxin component (TIGR02293 family)|nr:hypothetical protein [Thermoplasmata archaeon]